MFLGLGLGMQQMGGVIGAIGPVATQLAVTTQPDNTNAGGSAFSVQPVVEIRDASGVRVTTGAGATASVTVAIATGAGTLATTLTISAVAGVATFSGLSITGNNFNSLTFTSAGLTAATSNVFANGPMSRATASLGNLLTAANWDNGGTVLPHWTVDTLTLKHAMTLGTDLTIGAAGLAATVQLTIDATSTNTGSLTVTDCRLTYATKILLANGALLGYATVPNVAGFRVGGAAGVRYVIEASNAGSQTNTRMEMHGTSSAQFTWDKAAGAGNGNYGPATATTGGAGFIAEYTDFVDIGTSAGAVITDWAIYCQCLTGSTTQKFYLDHCNFTRCGNVTPNVLPAAIDCVMTHCYDTAPLRILNVDAWNFFNVTKSTTGLRIFDLNGLISSVNFGKSMANWRIKRSTCAAMRYVGLTDFTPPTEFWGIAFLSHPASSSTTSIGVAGGTESMLFNFANDPNASANFNPYTVAGMNGTQTMDNIINQYTGDAEQVDGVSVPGTAGTTILNQIRRLINLCNAKGLSSGGVMSEHGQLGVQQDVAHVTQHTVGEVAGSLNVMLGALYCGHQNIVNQLADSLFATPAPIVGSGGFGLIDYGVSPVGSGADTSISTLFHSTAGGSSTVIQYSIGAWSTTAGQRFQDASATLRVIATVASGPAIGEECTITANTATSVTVSGGFTGSVFTGVQFLVKVLDKAKDGAVKNNGYYNGKTGTNYDSTGATFTRMGADGLCCTTPANLNANLVNLGTGSDWVGGGPKFRANEDGYDFVTFDQDVLGFGVGTTWATGQSYVVGDVRSFQDATRFNNRVINFYCIAPHTSGAANKPLDNTTSWRNQWRFASEVRLARAMADGTLYSDATIWYNGDTFGTAATNITALEMFFSRVRTIKMPTSVDARSDAIGGTIPAANFTTGSTLGAVEYVVLP
jgi:hypothetical protein